VIFGTSDAVRRIAAAALFGWFAALSGAAVAQATPPFERDLVPGLGIAESPTEAAGTWEQAIEIPDSFSSFFLTLERADSSSGGIVHLTLVGDAGTMLADHGSGSREVAVNFNEPVSVVLTPAYLRPASGKVRVVLRSATGGAGPPARVTGVIADRHGSQMTPHGFEPVWTGVGAGQPLAAVARSGLAKLTFADRAYCTGFAITAELLVTAEHCLRKGTQYYSCPSIGIELGYLDNSLATTTPAACVEVVLIRPALDYALIKVKPAHGGMTPLDLLAPTASTTVTLDLLHHPYGQAAKVSRCKGARLPIDLSKPSGTRVRQAQEACAKGVSFFAPTAAQVAGAFVHECSSIGGSSGAPLLAGNRVIGLHFSQDYRYEPVSGSRYLSYTEYGCLTGDLRLGNWARDICAVVSDARKQRPELKLPSC